MGVFYMQIYFRNNCKIVNFGEDYYKIRNFLLKLNQPNFSFGRWDWMVTHSDLDQSAISKIGVWEHHSEIVALATFDCELGQSYIYTLDSYKHLKPEMLTYAQQHLCTKEKFEVLILDSDYEFQNSVATAGFIASQGKQEEAILPIDSHPLSYSLPDGFRITSMAENYDLTQYGSVLWRGFNHELDGEGPFIPSEEQLIALQNEMKRPNVNLDLKIAVVNANGEFVAYCGMWYDPQSQYAVVEPVATAPNYRRLGLAKAAVLEGIRRCGALGAKEAIVGSSQQFYYSIGFRPYQTSSWWIKK
jgi:ribosomal protein S18 acetylase RimI-like enzyme